METAELTTVTDPDTVAHSVGMEDGPAFKIVEFLSKFPFNQTPRAYDEHSPAQGQRTYCVEVAVPGLIVSGMIATIPPLTAQQALGPPPDNDEPSPVTANTSERQQQGAPPADDPEITDLDGNVIITRGSIKISPPPPPSIRPRPPTPKRTPASIRIS